MFYEYGIMGLILSTKRHRTLGLADNWQYRPRIAAIVNSICRIQQVVPTSAVPLAPGPLWQLLCTLHVNDAAPQGLQRCDDPSDEVRKYLVDGKVTAV